MANSDSRHTTPTLRWGETTGEVVDANVVEPSGGKKNTGWVPGVDGAVAEWFNWLWYAAGAFNRYVEASRAAMWTRNCVMAGASTSDGVVTPGVGMSVDVTAVKVWIDGAMYEVPAVTNLAVAAADPTDPRTDLVVAKVVSGTPQFAIVTGTPDPSPEPPALPAGNVAIREIDLSAADTIPGIGLDRRLFGAVAMDLLRANTQLAVGDMGSQFFLLVEDLGAVWSYKVGGSNNPILQISDFGRSVFFDADVITIDTPTVTFDAATVTLGGTEIVFDADVVFDADAVEFAAPATRKFDLSAADFIPTWTTLEGPSEHPYMGMDQDFRLFMVGPGDGIGAYAAAPVRVPQGATITAVRVYGEKQGAGSLAIRLYSRNKVTGFLTNLGGDTIATGDPDGPFILQNASIGHVVDQDNVYFIRAFFDDVADSFGADSALLWAAEVEYTETKPFEGL